MNIKNLNIQNLLIVSCFMFLVNTAFGQQPSSEGPSKQPDLSHALMTPPPFNTYSINDLLKITGNLRDAAASAERSVEGLKEIAAEASTSVEKISHSMSQISSEFDPFGFKEGYRTVQLQTRILQRQSQVINELQQAEIERLKRQIAAQTEEQSSSQKNVRKPKSRKQTSQRNRKRLPDNKSRRSP